MPKIEVKNTQGQSVGTLDLDDAVWAVEVNEHLLWEAVKWQRAKARSGTASTKTVAFTHGTNKKPYKQKGTGNARQGSMKAHHMVGGGRAFGPKPRDYEYSLNKKVKKGALRSASSAPARPSSSTPARTSGWPGAPRTCPRPSGSRPRD
jgi:large subunit ribosomal protein L4